MRAALAIALKDLRQRLRDRSAIIVAVIAPFGLAALLSPLYGGGSDELNVSFAVVDEDRGEVAAALREGALASLVEAGIANVVDVSSVEEARQMVDDQDADAAILIPAGFTAAVQAGQPATLTVVSDTDTVDASIAGQIAESAVREFAGRTAAVQLSIAGAQAVAPDESVDLGALATAAGQSASPVGLVDTNEEIKGLTAATFTAAGMSIFFLFFSAQFSFVSLIAERHEGTLARILASPIRPAAVVFGKVLVGYAIGLASMAVLVVASALLLGAEWGQPAAVALLVFAAVTASLGVMSFVATFARTEDQANGLGSIVAVTLGIVGGTFFPVWLGPSLLSTLSLLTPHQWWMRGLDDLSLGGAGVGDAFQATAVLLGYGVVFGALALLRARRMVTSL